MLPMMIEDVLLYNKPQNVYFLLAVKLELILPIKYALLSKSPPGIDPAGRSCTSPGRIYCHLRGPNERLTQIFSQFRRRAVEGAVRNLSAAILGFLVKAILRRSEMSR